MLEDYEQEVDEKAVVNKFPDLADKIAFSND